MTTEYATLLGVVVIVMSSAVISWGPALVHSFSHTRSVLVAPVP
ncbi:MAG: hypothetical protein R3B13_05650 [Polyangiaceae bacterium]